MKNRSDRLARQVALALNLAVAALLATAVAGSRAAAAPAGTASPHQQSPPAVALRPGDSSALPTIGIDEVKAGQRGYGLSVFAGDQPERFDVEVIGIIRNIAPDTSYILGRLSGHGLEASGVAAGMSGSPVFLDGRLAGAVAFGWPFSKDPVCGITPIALMRRLTTLGGAPSAVTAPPPVSLADLLAGRVPADLLARRLAMLQPAAVAAALPPGTSSGIGWSAVGFGDLAQGMLQHALGSLAPAGRAAGATGTNGAAAAAPLGSAGPDHPPQPAQLVPGSAVAAVLIDGDFQLAATGTVTDHLGDRILAFGHPFLGIGPTSVPMASSEVVTVLSSQSTSFKIANVGQIVGAFEQDRAMGIEGRLGALAPTIPMVVRIAGSGLPPPAASLASGAATAGAAVPSLAANRREFHVRLTDVPAMIPTLAGTALLSGLETASYASGPQSLELTAHLELEQYGSLVVHQTFDGDTAASAMAGHLLAVIAYLEQNSLARVRIHEVAADVEQAPHPLTATILGARADRAVVHPGDSVHVDVELQGYRGARFHHSVTLRLPAHLASGRYSLLVGDGASGDGARLALAPIDPVNIEQALGVLRSLHSRRDLTVLGFRPAAGIAAAGEVMPQLPGSIRSLWSASASETAVALRSTIVAEQHEAMPMPIDGLVRIDLDVRRRHETAAAAAPQEER